MQPLFESRVNPAALVTGGATKAAPPALLSARKAVCNGLHHCADAKLSPVKPERRCRNKFKLHHTTSPSRPAPEHQLRHQR